MDGAGSDFWKTSDQGSAPYHQEINRQGSVNSNEGDRTGSDRQGYPGHELNHLTDNSFNFWGDSQSVFNVDVSLTDRSDGYALINRPTTPSWISLSLRQWIKIALKTVGGGSDSSNTIHSPEYRNACLKIAKCLSSQIHEAEEMAANGIFDKLEQLPTDQDWADCVYVRVQANSRQTSSARMQPRDIWEEGLSQVEALPAVDTVARRGEETGEGIDTRVKSFLRLFEANHPLKTAGPNADATDEILDGDLFSLNYNHGNPSTSNQNTAAAAFQDESEQDHVNQQMEATADSLEASWGEIEMAVGHSMDQHQKQQIDELFDTFQEDDVEEAAASSHAHKLARLPNEYDHAPPAGRTAPVFETFHPDAYDLNSCLDIDSAEFKPRASSLPWGHEANRKNSVARRIYFLGMVFYELFSGGQLPHPRLYEVASSDGAFVSLPKLSLSDIKEDHFPDVPKRRQGPSGFNRDDDICNISCNHLKMLGIPRQLYQMILNMLDCIYGDLCGSDSYSRINDVTHDIQLMIEKPSKFLLKSVHMGMQSFSEQQIKETFMPRDDEFAKLKSCYRRSISASFEAAIITGESGIGKSWLAERVGRFVIAEGGMFLTGKFQTNEAAPFSALAAAFDQYCDLLVAEKDSDWVNDVVHKLHTALGQDGLRHLIKIIPKLSNLTSYHLNYTDVSTIHDESAHALQRLCYLMSTFVYIISSNSKVSLVLMLDDLQWADSASFQVLNQLLVSKLTKFFFLGSCRDDELHGRHALSEMLDNIRSFGINDSVIKLECMSKSTLNQKARIMRCFSKKVFDHQAKTEPNLFAVPSPLVSKISDLLCLSPRLTKSLSDIVYARTKGNPFFFLQLLFGLNRDGLLSFSLPQQRWVWDEDLVCSMELPDNIARCFANGIRNLPMHVQSAVRSLSIFGNKAKLSYIVSLESQLNIKIVEHLKFAETVGLISIRNGVFKFNHDMIQQAAYSTCNDGDRRRDHSTYGLCLMKLWLENGDADTLFTSTNQINLGGPTSVSNVAESLTMAKCNLRAGKTAMEMADFVLAHKFLTCGAGFLPDNHWQNHYGLSLELFELASRAALVSRNFQSFECIAGEVKNNGRCFEDKLNTYFNIMTSLVYTYKFSLALENGLTVLSQLGEQNVSSSLSHSDLVQQIQYTQSLIRGLSEEDILHYRPMTDTNKQQAMKFLAKLVYISVWIKVKLQPFLTLKIVQLTITHGLSKASPIGFAYFGSLLAKRGDIKSGYKFALLARRLMDKLDIKEFAGEANGILCEIGCFLKPIRESNELRTIAVDDAMRKGDVEMACLQKAQFCSTQLWAGANLSDLKNNISKASQFTKEMGHTATVLLIMTNQNTVLTLLGDNEESLNDAELETSIQENRNPRQKMVLLFHKLYLSFVLDYDDLNEMVNRFLQAEQCQWFLMFFDSVIAFILGLSTYKIYRETRQIAWKDMANKYKAEMKDWARRGTKWNFEQRYMLLEAEAYYSDGYVDKAEISYQKAIEMARENKFVNDEAMSCELAAKFYLDTGDAESALAHYKLAHRRCVEWGANTKADKLFRFMEENFRSLQGNDSPLPGSITEASSQQLSRRRGIKRGAEC